MLAVALVTVYMCIDDTAGMQNGGCLKTGLPLKLALTKRERV